MKNYIKTLVAGSLTVIALTTINSTAKADDFNKLANVTSISAPKKISTIIVSGNVELILIQDKTESVKVYDNYYANNALVQQEGSTLRISSFKSQKLTVVAHVNNLTNIQASEHAKVSTQGSFYVPALTVSLKDQATANLTTHTASLFTEVYNGAKLAIAGTTDDYTALISRHAVVNMNAFVAQNTTIDTRNGNTILAAHPKNNASKTLTFEDVSLTDLSK